MVQKVRVLENKEKEEDETWSLEKSRRSYGYLQ
jgi:hypothetical protein